MKKNVINQTEHLKVTNKEKLKDSLKKHTRWINFYEILIAVTMSIYGICDDMSFIDVKNVVFVFLAYMLFAMFKIKIVEKLLSHLFQKTIVKDKLSNYEEEHFEWKYKTLKKNQKILKK